jgi:hypothetical protein
MNFGKALRTLIQPKILLPIFITAALLFVALSLGNLGKVIGRIQAIPVTTMAIALGFAIVYLAFKALQLHLLLANLGAHPDRKRFALAFALGEIAVTIPLGIFAQNWVLSDEDRIQFGRSSAATVVMLLTEIVIVLLLLAVAGIPGWTKIQPLAGVALFAIAVIIFVILRFEPQIAGWADRVKQPRLKRAATAGIRLICGMKSLANARLLALNFLIAVIYLGALACAFLFVGEGLHVQAINYLKAATIYAFALASVLLTGGLLGHVGTVEVVGIAAAQAWGIGYTKGLALMLGFRIVWTGAIWLVTLPIVARYWRSRGPHTGESKENEESSDRGEEAAH